MISTTGYYSPDAVAARLERAKARTEKLKALASSIATQKAEAARAVIRRRRKRFEVVEQLRKRGLNWTEIGKKLGVTRQGARYIHDSLSPANPSPNGARGPSSATPEAAPSAKSSSHSQSA